jgi:hypothetical protein
VAAKLGTLRHCGAALNILVLIIECSSHARTRRTRWELLQTRILQRAVSSVLVDLCLLVSTFALPCCVIQMAFGDDLKVHKSWIPGLLHISKANTRFSDTTKSVCSIIGQPGATSHKHATRKITRGRDQHLGWFVSEWGKLESRSPSCLRSHLHHLEHNLARSHHY